MEGKDAKERLPVTYQRVLRWLDEGATREEIARRLAIDPHAVDPLISLAKAKFERLTEDEEEEAPSR